MKKKRKYVTIRNFFIIILYTHIKIVNNYYCQKSFIKKHRKSTKIFVENKKRNKARDRYKIFLKKKNKKRFNIIVIEIKTFLLFSS